MSTFAYLLILIKIVNIDKFCRFRKGYWQILSILEIILTNFANIGNFMPNSANWQILAARIFYSVPIGYFLEIFESNDFGKGYTYKTSFWPYSRCLEKHSSSLEKNTVSKAYDLWGTCFEAENHANLKNFGRFFGTFNEI